MSVGSMREKGYEIKEQTIPEKISRIWKMLFSVSDEVAELKKRIEILEEMI